MPAWIIWENRSFKWVDRADLWLGLHVLRRCSPGIAVHRETRAIEPKRAGIPRSHL